MASIHHRATLSAEPEAVWHLLSQFNATNMWHDRIAVSSMERSNQSSHKESTRTLQLADGEVIQERLLFIDAGRMTMTYGLSDSEGAFKEYASTVSVKPVQDGHQAQLEWLALRPSAGTSRRCAWGDHLDWGSISRPFGSRRPVLERAPSYPYYLRVYKVAQPGGWGAVSALLTCFAIHFAS